MGDHLILPGHAAAEYESGANADVGPDFAQAMACRRVLKALDPDLDVAWVRPGARAFEHPGRWHIVRRHPGGNDELNAYWVCQTPDGGYCPPNDEHVEMLKKIDSRSRDVYAQMTLARSKKKAARQREFEAQRRAFREMLSERLDHLYDARIAITPIMKGRASGLVGPDGAPISS